MIHKHLHRRGNIYYFRWRVPSDLRPILGVTEMIKSLRTLDQCKAIVRAGKFTLAIGVIKEIRQAYMAQEIDFGEYIGTIKQQWVDVLNMTRKRKFIQTGMVTVYSPDGSIVEIEDPGGDLQKEVAAAKELGLSGKPYNSNRSEPPSEILFSGLYESFLQHKSVIEGLSERMRREYARYFNALVEIMGDLPVSSITRKVLKDGILVYRSLPRRNKNPYRSLSVLELLEMDIPVEDRVADKTVLEVKKLTQGIFRHGLEEELISVSPARDLKLDLDTSRTFAPYSDAEVTAILRASFAEEEPWKKWLPILAAYTGARRGELVQLRKQDVKWDSGAERHYILITDEAGNVKTDNAIRQIPLHIELIGKGFLEFVDSAEGKLFEDLDPQAVTKWFSNYRDSLNIDRFNDYGDRKVFHSFRHSFITKSRGAGNSPEHVQQVVGHEKINVGVTDRYSHTQPLINILNVVDRVDYGGGYA